MGTKLTEFYKTKFSPYILKGVCKLVSFDKCDSKALPNTSRNLITPNQQIGGGSKHFDASSHGALRKKSGYRESAHSDISSTITNTFSPRSPRSSPPRSPHKVNSVIHDSPLESPRTVSIDIANAHETSATSPVISLAKPFDKNADNNDYYYDEK